MADLIAYHQYYSHRNFLEPSTMAPSTNGHDHKRSLSSGPKSTSAERTVTKAKSANDLTRLLADKTLPDAPSERNFSTLKDPRLASTPEDSESSSSNSHHPDLNNEVAALSVKLVRAINNQTTLDDDLTAARQDLEKAQARIQALELENGKYRRDVDNDVLVRKADTDYEISCVKAALADERSQRAIIEKGKKTIEQELETLTAALFEEANKMVAAAKLEREAVEKKNEQLRSQVKDTELLLASHQDQLAELKAVMHGLGPAKDDADVHTTISTTPSSPVAYQRPLPNIKKTAEVADIPEETPNPEELLPGPSTGFPQFIKTVCRTDVPAYEDFRELFTLAASSKPPSRAASGSYGGLNVMSLASLAGHTTSGFGSTNSSPAKSQTHSPNGSQSSPHANSSHYPLKETRFYKRVVTEDIDPTLRLDAAPGISWLTRRTVMGSICEGSLIVEPMPLSAKKFGFPCSVCGEHRAGNANERTHRFRTSDSETAQRYSLCVLCLEKVRSCCEFTGYLRLILDGHVRVSDPEEEKDAWEETIRLRERMFWARVVGGVVPVFSPANDVDGYLREAASAASIYSKDDSVQQPLSVENIKPLTGDGNDDDQGSVTDENYLSAASESSASSVADAPYASQNREGEDVDTAKHEASEQSAEQSPRPVAVSQNGAHVSEAYTSENLDRQSFDSAKLEISDQTVEQPTSSVTADNDDTYASDDHERQSFDSAKREVSEQAVEQSTGLAAGAHSSEDDERQSFDSVRHEVYEQTVEQSTISGAGAHSSEDYERQSFDSAKHEVYGQTSSVAANQNGETSASAAETRIQNEQHTAKAENHGT